MIAGMVDQVMAKGEEFLTSGWPDRFVAGSPRTRDAAAVMIAINTSTMVLQEHLARRMDVQPWSEAAIRRIGMALFDVFEAIGDMVDSDMWRELRAAVDAYPDDGKG
jgi:TetR/AcrR family transcriptional regulator, regulator of cefoperazone and chloramphenicol sensitivity